MIIACTKPAEEITKNTDRSNSSLSIERKSIIVTK